MFYLSFKIRLFSGLLLIRTLLMMILVYVRLKRYFPLEYIITGMTYSVRFSNIVKVRCLVLKSKSI
jgi:hypothetical protein